MEIPGRMEEERKLARSLGGLTKLHRAKLRVLMGSPPDPANVPSGFWDEVRRELAETLAVKLYLLYLAGGGELLRRMGVQTDANVARLSTSAEAYARSQSQVVASSVVQGALQKFTTHGAELALKASRASDPSAGPRDRVTKKDARDFAGKVFSEAKAMSVAVTETTRAQATSGERTAREIQGGSGENDLWMTERDERVCPVCRPLHRTARRIWSKKFPEGPPAHVNCRCEIRYVSEKITDTGGPLRDRSDQVAGAQ